MKALIILFLLPLILWTPKVEAKESNSIRVITYNTWGLPRPFLIKAKRFKQIATSIGQFEADIIGFQETFTKYAKILSTLKEYPYYRYGSPKIKGKKLIDSGLLTISKFPIVDSDYIVYSKCSGTDCLAAKGILWTKIAVPGIGDINVFNSHLNAGASKKVKRVQLGEAWEFIQKHLDGRSTIFLGDLNIQPDTVFYNYIKYYMDFEDSLDLYLADNPEYYDDKHVIYTYVIWKRLFWRRLDYFWLKDIGTKHMGVNKYQVIFNDKNGEKLSDHLGIMLDLEFN
jgi:endonuclease/exonuclease/phosphatase family metal-dependent hydrolase